MAFEVCLIHSWADSLQIFQNPWTVAGIFPKSRVAFVTMCVRTTSSPLREYPSGASGPPHPLTARHPHAFLVENAYE